MKMSGKRRRTSVDLRVIPEATLHGLEGLYALDPLGFLLGLDEAGEACPELLSTGSMSHASETLRKAMNQTEAESQHPDLSQIDTFRERKGKGRSRAHRAIPIDLPRLLVVSSRVGSTRRARRSTSLLRSTVETGVEIVDVLLSHLLGLGGREGGLDGGGFEFGVSANGGGRFGGVGRWRLSRVGSLGGEAFYVV